MSIIEKAVNWIIGIANDNTHGYDQGSRWSPDYDCSSLVISAWKQAGVNLTCTYTGNMYANMVNKGFSDITSQVNLATGSGLARGDVLLNVANHTAMYIGNGQIFVSTGTSSISPTLPGSLTFFVSLSSTVKVRFNYFDIILVNTEYITFVTDKPVRRITFFTLYYFFSGLWYVIQF